MPPDFDFDVYLLYSGAKADCELVEKIAEKLEREYKKKVPGLHVYLQEENVICSHND